MHQVGAVILISTLIWGTHELSVVEKEAVIEDEEPLLSEANG